MTHLDAAVEHRGERRSIDARNRLDAVEQHAADAVIGRNRAIEHLVDVRRDGAEHLLELDERLVERTELGQQAHGRHRVLLASQQHLD